MVQSSDATPNMEVNLNIASEVDLALSLTSLSHPHSNPNSSEAGSISIVLFFSMSRVMGITRQKGSGSSSWRNWLLLSQPFKACTLFSLYQSSQTFKLTRIAWGQYGPIETLRLKIAVPAKSLLLPSLWMRPRTSRLSMTSSRRGHLLQQLSSSLLFRSRMMSHGPARRCLVHR